MYYTYNSSPKANFHFGTLVKMQQKKRDFRKEDKLNSYTKCNTVK